MTGVALDNPDPVADRVEVKVAGKRGQISLGRRYAGKTLRLEHRRDGTTRRDHREGQRSGRPEAACRP